MNKTEILATLGIQDRGWRQTNKTQPKHNTTQTTKNTSSRDPIKNRG